MIKRFRKAIGGLNDLVAEGLTVIVGSMWCAYAFALFALAPLVVPGIEAQVQYVSGAFLQLVLLPVIMVGQAVLSRAADRRARRDHEMLLQQTAELKLILAELRQHATKAEKYRRHVPSPSDL